jgi:NADPH:quinone reductase-like Zn-dependent oxidoreductase
LNIPNGATHVANYKTEDFSAVVKDVTSNKGVDVVIDFVGQSHWKKNIESLATDGKMTMLALMSGGSISAGLHRFLPKRKQDLKWRLSTSTRFYINAFAFKDLLSVHAPCHTKPT